MIVPQIVPTPFGLRVVPAVVPPYPYFYAPAVYYW